MKRHFVTNKIKVLVADDTLIAREGWKKILTTEDDIIVIGEVRIAQETLRKVRELQPDVLLMDLKWLDDETAGVSAIQQVKQAVPATKIVAVTAYPDLVQNARRSGAEAALSKGFSRAELIETIRAVHQLESFPVPTPTPAADQLSEREQEVLVLMARGMTDRQIADQLKISASTAKNHAQSIINKFDASNRAQAVAIGFKRGMLKEGA
jgi:DNA-binding NarL/FixJ family response regulator